MKIKAWIYAMRLRTLPLSSAGVLMGTALAYNCKGFSWAIFLLCLWTIVLFQVLSNFANDLGDAQKGIDNDYRKGPPRAVQSGIITTKEMKNAIILCIVLILFSGLSLLLLSFNNIDIKVIIIFVLGAIGIVAAIKYTLGKKAYGYYGLGDIFVFLFFGCIPVAISYIVQTNRWDWLIILPGFTLGLLSTAVLNLNNLRDYKNDKICGKRTLIVQMGIKKGKIYHAVLIYSALLIISIYSFFTFDCYWNLMYFIAFIPILLNINTVNKITNTEELNPYLKKLAIAIFNLSILFFLGVILCS